jgi:hypothetical protein
MDIQDGFIVGIDNYCDRWCEVCDFTSRCRSFAEMTAFRSQRDPSMAAIATIHFSDAPPIRPELASAMPTLERRSVLEAGSAERASEDIQRVHRLLIARVEGYAFHAAQSVPLVDAPPALRDAARIVRRYCFFISGKIYRALMNVARPYGDSLDANGSAKAALVALERSHGAWLALSAAKLVPRASAEALISDLVWLRLEIERIFPHARTFVRPGLDETDAVTQLRAEDGR